MHVEADDFRDTLAPDLRALLFRCVQEVVHNVVKHADADEMSDVLDWVLARNADPASPLFGRIATNRLGWPISMPSSAGSIAPLLLASTSRSTLP